MQMDRIAEVLLDSVLDKNLPKTSDPIYKFFEQSRQFPRVEIKIEKEFKNIKQQYINICKTIVDRTPKKMTLLTLFAANEQLMSTYCKFDNDIPKLHAIWFTDVLEHIKNDSPFYFNENFVIYCILTSMFISYIMFK